MRIPGVAHGTSIFRLIRRTRHRVHHPELRSEKNCPALFTYVKVMKKLGDVETALIALLWILFAVVVLPWIMVKDDHFRSIAWHWRRRNCVVWNNGISTGILKKIHLIFLIIMQAMSLVTFISRVVLRTLTGR